jgi:ribulose-5-phosphate 4-epimerase/fuculose-1-phosphate aldolase
MQGHGAVTVGQTVKEVCGLAVLLEQTARTQYLAEQLGKPRTIETRGKEKLFEAGFREFSDVIWEHHSRRENSSFLSSFAA